MIGRWWNRHLHTRLSSFLARELAQRVKGLDYRAAGAAAYLGTGSVWAMGLSSSAAMLMATKSSLPASLYAISGLIPTSRSACAASRISAARRLPCSATRLMR